MHTSTNIKDEYVTYEIEDLEEYSFFFANFGTWGQCHSSAFAAQEELANISLNDGTYTANIQKIDSTHVQMVTSYYLDSYVRYIRLYGIC